GLDVAAMVFNAFAEALNGTGPRALGLRRPAPAPLSGASDFKRLTVRGGPAVRITFSLGAGEGAGLLSAWMPQRVILETRVPSEGGPQTEPLEWRQRFNDEVRR